GHVNPKNDPEAYYNIFFNFDAFKEKPEELITTMTELQGLDGMTILDISDISLFEDENIAPITSVACILANHVTCSDQDIQEIILETTGRFATIVEEPLFRSELTKPFIEKKNKVEDINILWYGLNSEIFSIKPYQSSTPYEITTYIENK